MKLFLSWLISNILLALFWSFSSIGYQGKVSISLSRIERKIQCGTASLNERFINFFFSIISGIIAPPVYILGIIIYILILVFNI